MCRSLTAAVPSAVLTIVAAVSTASTAATQQALRVPGQFPTIGAALLAAQTGDTVWVDPGTYAESGLDFGGRGVVLRSVAGAGVTTIDGGGAGTVIRIAGGEPRGTAVIGFTIRNGVGSGGGIRVETPRLASAATHAEIRDCAFDANAAPSASGGGIAVLGADVVVRACTFTGNTASSGSGGGLVVEGVTFGAAATAVIEGCRFFDNVASSGSGGGLSVRDAANVTVRSCLFVRNRTPSGGGGAIAAAGGFRASPTLRVESCTLTANQDTALRASAGAVVDVRNSIVWQNTTPQIANNGATLTVAWSDVEGGFSGPGNLNVPPAFVAPSSDDYRLQPASPLVDAADPSAPVAGRDDGGDPRMVDGDLDGVVRNDIGADEVAPLRLDATGTFVPGSPFTLALTSTGAPFSTILLAGAAETDVFFAGVGQLLVGGGASIAFPMPGSNQIVLQMPPSIPFGDGVLFQGLGVSAVARFVTTNTVDVRVR